MHHLSLHVPDALNARLALMAKETRCSENDLILRALEEYLEDIADAVEMRNVQASYGPEDRIALEEIERRYGLHDD